MVLAELGQQISDALKKLNKASVVDDKLLDEILKEICNALMASDVNIKYVMDLRKTVSSQIKLQMADKDDANAAANLKRIILKVVVDELTKMLGSENQPYEFVRGKSNVVMFVGLQGSGKTTTCTKFAYQYMKRGWRVGLVCADTFRAGAFEQLKMNAAKIKCPFFGHKNETDPVLIASEGVEFFREKKYEIIIVDTSGRHKQEQSLFDEMLQVEATVKPDTAIFVMDGSIGQACYAQAKAFHETIKVGQVIVTKLDGHAKGGGALSAVAATKSPIIYIGTGEHFEDFESFEAASFIKRLLGLGDLQGLLKKVSENMNSKKSAKLMENLKEGKFTLRDMRDQFAQVLSMGNIGQLASMIPGLNSNLITKDKEKESTAKIQRFLTAMDSMNKDELDGIKPLCEGRIKRIARGAGVHVSEIHFLINEHKKFGGMVKQLGGLTGMMGGKGGMPDMEHLKRNPHEAQKMMKNMQANMDPNMMKQMGGMQGMMNMAKSMQGGGRGGAPDMGKIMQMAQQMAGGMGGGMPGGPPGAAGMPGMPPGGQGGMPDMGAMMQMMQGMGGGAGGAPGGMPGMPPGGGDMNAMMQQMQAMMGGGAMPGAGRGGMQMPPGMPGGRGGMRMRRR